VQLHGEESFGAGFLSLVAFHHALMPAVVPALGGVGGELGGLAPRFGHFRFGHLAVRQLNFLDTVPQHHVRAHVLARSCVGFLPAVDNAAGDLLQAGQPA